MIRDLREADISAVCDIADRSFAPIFQGFREMLGPELLDRLYPECETSQGRYMEKTCRERPGQVLVCEAEGRVVGFLTFILRAEKHMGEISTNGVDPDFAGRGYGQALYAAALERFRREGLEYASVTTGLDDGHAPARRAYERAGFDIRQEKVTYYRKL